jgi:hypothetical protein
MKILQAGLFIVALVCGIAAMGCWIFTQSDAGIPRQEGPLILVIMCLSSVFFVTSLAASAFLQNRMEGARSVARRALFLVGICGILVLLFFIVSSRAMIFKFGPLPSVLLGTFIGLALFFRRWKPTTDGDQG